MDPLTWQDLNVLYEDIDVVRVAWVQTGAVRNVKILIMHLEQRYGNTGVYIFSRSLSCVENTDWRGGDNDFRWDFKSLISAEEPAQDLVTFLNDKSVPECWRAKQNVVFCEKIADGAYEELEPNSIKILRQLERLVGFLEGVHGLDNRVLRRIKGMIDRGFDEITAPIAMLRSAAR